jgi:hypothetical protein
MILTKDQTIHISLGLRMYSHNAIQSARFNPSIATEMTRIAQEASELADVIETALSVEVLQSEFAAPLTLP